MHRRNVTLIDMHTGITTMKTSFVLVTTTMGGLYHVIFSPGMPDQLEKGQRKSTYNFRTPHPCPKKELFVYRISEGWKTGKHRIYERMGQFRHGLRAGDEDGFRTDIAPELHIPKGVADHDRCGEVDLREFFFCHETHTRIGFSTRTRLFGIGAVIDPVDAAARSDDRLHHPVMNSRQVLLRH